MKIENSNVALYSQANFEYSHQVTTRSQLHFGSVEEAKQSAISLDFSFSMTTSVESQRVVYKYEENMSHEDRLKKLIIEKLLGRLYGENVEIPLHPQKEPQEFKEIPSNPYQKKFSEKTQFVGAVFESTEEYYQKQTIDFSASLQIQTPTQSFEMNLDISFTKELYESHSSRLVIGDEKLIDPLVINYDQDVNPFENLSHLRFEFDLDQDGETDIIPLLQRGAGFLALDKNGNNIIDDGSELFGTQSGNGFKDLSVYDRDKNNWIDENDAVFDRLKIWQKNDLGEGKLISLLDLNVGAIYLGDIQSGYKYQSSIDSTEAIQKTNGVFVKEDGSGLGMVSSLDIAI